jgi:ABC-type branched-subunit amino acid transport system substrate-binding protein
MFGALSYDAALAIGTAWRAAPEKTRAGLRDALTTVRLDGAGGPIAFDAATRDVVGRSIVVITVGGAR